MGKFTMTHDIACSEDVFWKLFWDTEMNTALFKHLQFPSWELLGIEETDTKKIRRVKAIPKMDAPGPVAKLLGSSFGYTEVGTWDKATKVFSFVITPTSLADKMKNEGTIKVEALGPDKCRRVVSILAEAKIFGIGGMVESSLEKSYRTGWGESADFIGKWAKEHP